MAQSVMETERKYDVDEDAALPSWSRLAGVGDAVGPQEELLEATYFDTPDLRLAAAGVTLRRRRGGSDSGWHLKLPVAAGTREEVRVGFAPGELRRRNPQPPQELTGLIRSLTHAQPLAPVAELSTVRRMWRLTDSEGHDLVAIVDDHVTGRTFGEATETRTWREIEVELGDRGDTTLLDRLERRLDKAGIRRSDAPSKLARLLGPRLPDRGLPHPSAPHRRSTLASVLLAYLRAQADAIRVLDPAVRRERPDSVHQMRVATRRMRSALQAYRMVIPRAATRDLSTELAWLASVLGTARDLEVLEQRLHEEVGALPEDLVLGPVQAQLTRYFAGRQARAHEDLVAALDGERYLALLTAIDDLIADPPLASAAGQPARRRLTPILDRTYRRVAVQLKTADELPPGQDRDTALHEARKAAKRLRYAAEAATPSVGKAAHRLVSRTKQLQELLGQHQDATVSLAALRELGTDAHLDGGNGFTFGLLYQHAAAANPDAELRPAAAKLRKAVKALA
jgi:CHAD domain-containing protein